MANKRKQLLAAAAKSVRKPDPDRLKDERKRKPYGDRQTLPVTFSFFASDYYWLEDLIAALKRAGYPANSSTVLREAILRLKEDLTGKTLAQILTDFAEHQAKRS